MRTYAIVNRKGGVGKTTTAVELAYILATSCHQRVLFIDADSQGNGTAIILAQEIEELEGAGLAEALRYNGLEYWPDVICQSDIPGLDVMPATESLGDFELECLLGRETADFNRLRNLLQVIEEDNEYDAVVIDCPPYYSISCLSALAACNSVIIPTGVDAYSTTGMAGLVRQIDNIRRACPEIQIAGVLVTQTRRSPVSMDAISILRDRSPVPVFATTIRRSEKAVESTWARTPIGDWSPFSAAAKDYRAWVAELLEKEGWNHA